MMSNQNFIENLLSVLGEKGWVDSENCLRWQTDWLKRYGKQPIGVARPCSTKEVSKVISLCNEHNVHIVPQGGNTSLVGGSVLSKKNGIILSLDRMDSILHLDEANRSISIEAGVILENLHNFLKETNLIFPMHLGSEGSAQIGGLLSTNAGGIHAFRYGMMCDLVIGLEVVLPNGEIWDGMRAVQKDNAGYQLRKLFCGSEGTLGVITKTILKLSSAPKQELTALLAINDFSGLIELGKMLRSEAEEFLIAMEFFSHTGLSIAVDNITNLNFPLEKNASFYVLLEVGSGSKEVPLDLILGNVMEWGMAKGIIVDGALAKSEKQRSAFWRLREEQPEGQRRLGKQLKHDVSIPLGNLPEFIEVASKQCDEILNNVQINSFGHLGDGNIHFNLSPPHGQKDFSGLDKKFTNTIYNLATKMKGSFAAEHGIGQMKISLADELRSSVERNLMKQIKRSIDQKNISNPGVVISSSNIRSN